MGFWRHTDVGLVQRRVIDINIWIIAWREMLQKYALIVILSLLAPFKILLLDFVAVFELFFYRNKHENSWNGYILCTGGCAYKYKYKYLR